MFSLAKRLTTKSNYNTIKSYCIKTAKSNLENTKSKSVKPLKQYGQPSFESHPHLIKKNEVTLLLTRAEFQGRRHKLIQHIVAYAKKNSLDSKKHLIVIPSSTKQYMSDKIPYVFRQNTEFLYLSGCQEPDCCLVISVGENADNHCATLFMRDKDEHAELWDGPRTHSEDAPHVFGVDQSLPMSELGNFIISFKKTHKDINVWYDYMTPVQNFTHKIVSDYITSSNKKSWLSPKSFIHHLRLYKSQAEIALMQKTCDIASQAFIKTISASKPGICESQIFAQVDYECRMLGADFLAYPPVVAGGNRATTIHYINNNQIVNDKELLLMDAGCEYHGYASDITRTWPINGKFTPQQREIYEVVYDAQKQLIEYCGKFPTLDALFEEMCRILGKNLQNMKLIGIQPSSQHVMKAAYQLCPHHVSHYLGMDIHDTPLINRNINIEPGMIITIEPGIYIQSKHTHIPKDYHGIGIRIEDDVLITENGPVVLSRNCPKTIEEIETLASENVQ